MCKNKVFLCLLIISQLTSGAIAQQDKSNNNAEIRKKTPHKDVLVDKSGDESQIDLLSVPVTKLDTTKNITTIAFGSCNKHHKPQTMWESVAANKPDLWIWLGDIIYADTTDMKALATMYRELKTSPEYKKMTATTPYIGVYDDHDFGANDAGKGYPMKKSSKKILMDFLNVPANAPVRKREGAYQSYTFGKGEQKVKVIVMDTRYFRDTLLPDETKVKRYIPNMEGDILGETQWKWLEKELKSNTANFTLLCSSIQVLSDEHPHEKWGNFPNARKRLLTLIVKSKPKNLMILSGDRHMAEISKMDLQGLDYPLYDFTSSGMTHIRSGSSESNKFRVGDMIVKKNFGLLKLSWEGSRPTVSMQVRTHGNELLQEIITKY
jgi:alkaline phosphatase D